MATFEANPAACPSAATVGSATVHTPLLGQALVGPAFLVSYGSAQFPDVVFVLQGEGVTVELDTKSSVSATGVLTATASAIPDAPLVSFAAEFPPGEDSLFASTKTSGVARASQCGEDLVAVVRMTGQNSAVTSASPQLQIAGCEAHLAVAVVRARMRRGELSVTVRTSQSGRLSIAGGGLRGLVRSVGAGTHTLLLALTATGRSAVRGHRSIELTAQLTAGGHTVRAGRRVGL